MRGDANPPTPLDDNPTIVLDGEPIRAPGQLLTGAQILSLKGLDTERFDVVAEGHHGLRIPAEEAVEVHDGARFRTVPR